MMKSLEFLFMFFSAILADNNNSYGILITILIILAIVALILYLFRGRH